MAGHPHPPPQPIECIFGNTVQKQNKALYEQFCWMHPMNVSLNEDKWSADEIYKHIEGMGPPKANDGEDFVFTYYQWLSLIHI